MPNTIERNTGGKMIRPSNGNALAYQTDTNHFIVAYYTGPILVNLLVNTEELETVIFRLRGNGLVVEFDWMEDRK